MDALSRSTLSDSALQRARELGVCVRCCLRFASITDLNVYTTSEEELVDAVHAFVKKSGILKVDSQPVKGCTCCLGVMDSSFHDKILTDVEQLATVNYDIKSFSLNIKLPSVILLREYSLLEFLRSDVENFPCKAPFATKEVLKAFLAPSISKILKNVPCANSSEFAVLIDIKHEESNDELRQIPAIKKQLEGTRKRGRGPPPIFDGFGAVSRALAALSTMPETIKSPPTHLITAPQATILFERNSVYMQGRYLKFQRGLSQTPWILDGERMGESSVEECIGDIALPFFRGTRYKFHSAGREDVDVRMLGNGRPFILEIMDAKKGYLDQIEYDQIKKAVNDANNGAVEIMDVKRSTKDYFARLQAGADSKKKTYCCVVWSEKVLTPDLIAKIDGIEDLMIDQQTPIRVLHRRTLMTRPKIIHTAKCEMLNKHYMLLRLKTSAGTYVKEFVHGDRGRTNPNIASILGCDADIIQLDVERLIDDN